MGGGLGVLFSTKCVQWVGRLLELLPGHGS